MTIKNRNILILIIIGLLFACVFLANKAKGYREELIDCNSDHRIDLVEIQEVNEAARLRDSVFTAKELQIDTLNTTVEQLKSKSYEAQLQPFREKVDDKANVSDITQLGISEQLLARLDSIRGLRNNPPTN